MKNIIILSLGSNIEPRLKFINKSINLIREYINVVKISRIYETIPWGYKNQEKFLNLSILGFTDITPINILNILKEVEKKVGRKERFRWGPREIDIDIIYYGNLIIRSENLTIPHKHRLQRSFVMIPIFEIAPIFMDPEYKTSISSLVKIFIRENDITTLLKSRSL